MDIKFETKNKKNIVIAGIFILIVVLVSQFIYFPKYREVRRLNVEYRKIKRDIDELYNFIGGKEDLKDNIIKMREGLALLESAFPYEKEVSNIIKEIDEEARRFKINVLSLKPRNFEIYRDHEGRELKISDCFCKCMPLTLNVESRYRGLGEFLMSLETNKTPIISIEEVNIEKDENITPRIKSEIDLVAYMLGK